MSYKTNQNGLLNEMRIMTYFIEMGYSVSRPLNDDSRYDCILDKNGKLYRIQIKTPYLYNNTVDTIIFRTSSVGNQGQDIKYSKDDIDYFAIFWDNEVYLLPVEDCQTYKKNLTFK